MNINAINTYRSALQLPAISTPEAPQEGGPAGFGSALAKAVEQMGGLQQRADDAIFKLSSGQPIELHDAMMAMEEAQLGLQMAIQVRSKVVEAYQEVMRIQV